MEKKYCIIFHLVFAVIISICCDTLQAMVYDNQYLPELQKLLVKKPAAYGQLMVQPFVWIGEQSFFEEFGEEERGGFANEGEVPLFNINGVYNQITLDNALKYIGKINQSTFRSDLIGASPALKWSMDGIIRAQGLGLTFYQPFTRHFSWGFNFFMARLTTGLNFQPNKIDFTSFTPGDFTDLYDENNVIQDILGLRAREYTTVGISDIEAYVRLGIVDDYKYKMRHLDFGFNFGVLIPTAQPIDYFNPAAIPLGGNGHWGIFASLDGQFELKENLGVGLLLRLNKRFARKANRRMVQFTEPNNYGVLYGASKVDPGVTVIFSPYGQLLRLRSGFGLQVQYTLVYHENDHWQDLRNCGQPCANIELMNKRSQWANEYVNVAALYDFAKDSKERTFKPIITFAVDIPVQFLITKRAAKTFGISLTVESTLW
ncbi:MAG: hypothetical protein K2X90_04625 [Candidatus Babeliaceae bacterium]|nr:hypothetical protein [Candidatus Babeliaceae bacterium]